MSEQESIRHGQLDIAWEDKAENFSRVRSLLASHPALSGSLVVLPEMFASGFSMNPSLTRQGPERADESFLAETRSREYSAVVIGGVRQRWIRRNGQQ